MMSLRYATVLASGALFGFGLSLSSMVQPESVLGFLNLTNLGLLLVLGCAVLVTLATYQIAPRLWRRPLLGGVFHAHRLQFSGRTIIGAAIFGVGWGLCGVCPGPAIAGLGAGNWPVFFALAGIVSGAWVQGRFFGAADERTSREPGTGRDRASGLTIASGGC